MGKGNAPRLRRYVPQVILATSVVMLLPVFAVWMVRASGAVTGMVPLILLGAAISLVLGWAGRRYWEARPGSGDLLFGELMAWGFVRRWRNERRLASATRLLGLTGREHVAEAVDLSPQEQAELLEQLAEALEARDPYTSGHSRRVARHAAMIAKKMGLPSTEVTRIRTAGLLHDVGKIDLPLEVLHKPGKLSDEEYREVKKHPVRGARMIHRHVDERLAMIVAHHHERLDGHGYPAGIAGESIPLGARIIAVADTFDALTSTRPYRSARPHKKALRILNEEAGTQLDPDAVRAFTSHYSGMRPIAAWAFVTGLPQRVLYPLFGEGAAGGAISAAKVMAATAVAVGAGSAVAATAPIVDQLGSSPATAAVQTTAAVQQIGPGDSPPPADGGPGTSKTGGGSGTKGNTPASTDPTGSATDPGRPPDASGDSGTDTSTDPASGNGNGNNGSGSTTTRPGNSGSRPGGNGNGDGNGNGTSGSGGDSAAPGNSGSSNAGGNGNGNANGHSGSGSGSGSSPGNSGSSNAGGNGHGNSGKGLN